MTEAQEKLKQDIERIDDETVIEKIRIFIMGILAQQAIEQASKTAAKPCGSLDCGR